MIVITPRILTILRYLRLYKFVSSSQLRRWVTPHDKDGAVLRECLRKMRTAGLAHRLKAEVHDPLVTSSVPVWIPTEAGSCVLASHTGNPEYLLDRAPSTTSWTQFGHFVAVTEVMHALVEAWTAHPIVKCQAIYFEHDLITNPNGTGTTYRTYTVVAESPRRIVCVPDACFELQVGEARRAYYLELSRGTDGSPSRELAKKSPGYTGLLQTKLFQRHFPQAQDFRVLTVCTLGPLWRDSLRKAATSLPNPELYLFASSADFTGDFLHQPIFHPVSGEPRPLVRAMEAPATPASLAPGGPPLAKSQAGVASEGGR